MKNTCKNNYFFLLVSFIVTALDIGTPALAQQDKTGEVDKIFAGAKPDAPRCVVAVSHQGKLVVFLITIIR